MKERFDDEKLYCADCQSDFIVVRNYQEVLQRYTYQDYENKFRECAAQNTLLTTQRPKLKETEFCSLRQQLLEATANFREDPLLVSEKNEKAVLRLLLTDALHEDYGC